MQGIMMIEPLYRQTLAGEKTMTRRSGGLDAVNGNVKKKIEGNPDDWTLDYTAHSRSFCNFKNKESGNTTIQCLAPRYKMGEIVFIKEPTAEISSVVYAYDYPEKKRSKIKWKNKMFMPAVHARLFLEITGIKCERLMDISNEDCIAEGIEGSLGFYKNYENGFSGLIGLTDPRKSFLSLFRKANKLSAKKDIPNSWVWVYSYRLITDTDHIQQIRLSLRK